MTAPFELPQGFKLTVLIPVFNEERTVEEIVRRVCAVDIPMEVIIVDDGSTDDTPRLLRESVKPAHDVVQLHFHPRNIGKGAAIRTALEHATGDVCLIQDGDLELDPREYWVLLRPIIQDGVDAVYGSRFAPGRPHQVLGAWHTLGNKLLTGLTNIVFNVSLTDAHTCYKVMRTDLLKSFALRARKFDIDPEITAKLSRAQVQIFEVPISYKPRDIAQGKKVRWLDGFRAIFAVIRYRLF